MPALKYALLQLPGVAGIGLLLLALVWLGALSDRTAGWLLALWLAKDVALYPLLRHAYSSDAAHGGARLIGRRAMARQRLAPDGYVAVAGELWRAEVQEEGAAVEAGESVRIVAARRLTLIVVPERNGEPGGLD